MFSQSLLKLSHSSHSTAGNFDYRTAADYYFSDSRNPNGLCYLKTMFMMNFLVYWSKPWIFSQDTVHVIATVGNKQ